MHMNPFPPTRSVKHNYTMDCTTASKSFHTAGRFTVTWLYLANKPPPAGWRAVYLASMCCGCTLPITVKLYTLTSGSSCHTAVPKKTYITYIHIEKYSRAGSSLAGAVWQKLILFAPFHSSIYLFTRTALPSCSGGWYIILTYAPLPNKISSLFHKFGLVNYWHLKCVLLVRVDYENW